VRAFSRRSVQKEYGVRAVVVTQQMVLSLEAAVLSGLTSRACRHRQGPCADTESKVEMNWLARLGATRLTLASGARRSLEQRMAAQERLYPSGDGQRFLSQKEVQQSEQNGQHERQRQGARVAEYRLGTAGFAAHSSGLWPSLEN
jgi:hypothetical protein